eukprot:gene1462-2085_t
MPTLGISIPSQSASPIFVPRLSRRSNKGSLAAERERKLVRVGSKSLQKPIKAGVVSLCSCVAKQTAHNSAIVKRGSKSATNFVTKAVAVEANVDTETELWSDEYDLISTKVFETDAAYRVEFYPTGVPGSTLLHWAVDDWQVPDEAIRPSGTNQVDDKAVQTPLGDMLTINIPKDVAPRSMVFVLKEIEPEEKWHNNGSSFIVNIKPPNAEDIVKKALDAEVNWGSYTLMARFTLALENLGMAEKIPGGNAMGFIFTWLRLSALKQLTWSREGNYQPKDMAHVQKALVEQLHNIARSNDDATVRQFARMTTAGIPRGGGDSEQIRLEILNILRRHGIREGHRPGIEDHFLEQWHQKLHSNTNKDDIAICEAYLHFLHTGNVDDMYWHLHEYNGITKEQLASMKCGWKSDGITGTPNHMPQMIPDFQHYLWILKGVHSGADLDTMAEMCKGHLDEDLVYHLYEVVNNKEAWWVAGKVVEVRSKLENYWRNGYGGRDVFLLDIALEKFYRLAVERSDFSELEGDDLFSLIELTLRNDNISRNEDEDLSMCLGLWQKVMETDRWTDEGATVAYAASERVLLALTNFTGNLYERMQPHAETFKEACDLDKAFIDNFSEEVIRGHSTFVLSQLVQTLQPKLREAAGLSPWQVVSLGSSELAMGTLLKENLEDIQGASYDKPQARPPVVLSDELGGLEDIPAGVVAVISSGSVDMLSHSAIRARNQGVLLACCSDAEELAPFAKMAGEAVQVSVTADGKVSVGECATTDLGVLLPAEDASSKSLKLEVPKEAPSSWAVQDTDFKPSMVGAKGKHLATLGGILKDSDINVPTSVALPFGSFERCLHAPENAETAAAIAKLQKEITNGEAPNNGELAVEALGKLDEMREQVLQLNMPAGVKEELQSSVTSAGMAGAQNMDDLWTAIRRVWASQYGDRAWLSRQTMGIPEEDLRMACLIQTVVPARYAFVMHTVNPLNPDGNEMLGEVVVGLGETLVSNTPGRPLAFTCGKVTYPWLAFGAVICRSDSNAEDLDEFAGAGLYDSVLVGDEPVEEAVDYTGEDLMWDSAFRTTLLAQLAQVGANVETALKGVPQDIEGTVGPDGEVYVVQARPQIINS